MRVRTAFVLSCLLSLTAWGVEFERIVIDDALPGGYQVEVADVNGDGKPDIVGLGGGTCAWYENPTWTKRIVSTPKQTPGIISSATADLDGDGKAEIAIAYEFAMNEPKKGKLALATQSTDGGWALTPIADVPSIHRLRWGDLNGDNRLDLVVAPIFGKEAKPPKFDQEFAYVRMFLPGPEPKSGRWEQREVIAAPVLHAIDVRPLSARDDRDRPLLLLACNDGVLQVVPSTDPQGNNVFAAFDQTAGAPGEAPKKGSSEVHFGRLKDGRQILATIDPWHGSQVAVCVKGPGDKHFGPRTVIDDTLNDGHALWTADVDGDGDDEVFAGHRGADPRVSMYDFDGKTWNRTVLDTKIAAQDLRGGDLDGDGTPDVVAIGGQTHNVVWYRPRKAK